jgi:glycyl-tRNA synthetase beta chain
MMPMSRSDGMAELLIELFSEEIPARMQRQAAGDLQRLITDGLTKANLTYNETRIYWTPRRLTLVVEGLPTRQPDLREEKKGPRVGAPDQAVQGFLRSAGLDSLDQCEQQDTPKGPVWIAVVEKKGGPVEYVLPEVIENAIRALPWPKSMRFASNAFRWVRPLHRILAVFNSVVVERDFDLDRTESIGFKTHGFDASETKIAFSNTSSGHRFLSPELFSVAGFDDYIAKLREAHVVLDPEERKQAILDGLRSAADREGLTVKDDPALLEEVTNLVEYPDVLIGKIDDEFMDVPAEALSTSMRAHQKYFSLIRPDGSLAPRFAVVANMKAADGGAKIVAGNERVLRARLADAKFFWDQDRAVKLEDRVEDLKKVVFHAKLGTVAERVERLSNQADVLSQYIPGCDSIDARRAAKLAKADLTTEMVGEFPELQGIMGRYYALAQNEKPAVADAIAQHYSPAGPNDACPTAPLSVAVALAEKLDTLVGFWLIDEKPTGSKDPFALRRAALGVIRIVLENGVRLPLTHVIAESAGLYGEQGSVSVNIRDLPKITADLLSFFADRLRVHLKDEGVSHSLIQALFALGDEDDLVRLVARVHALKAFLESEDGANLLTAYRRAANILRAEEKKDGATYSGKPDSALFATPEETALAAALDAAEDQVKACIEGEDFGGAMTALAGLRQPVDAFFEAVIVNADEADLRKNRLLLLARIRSVMGTLADFGQIEG